MPETPLTPAQAALEQEGLDFLRNGKFRKARDAFKALHKSQPARALPLLIEANLGLANDMMSKGLVSEANQVLAYLKTIAPASVNLVPTQKSTDNRDAWAAMVPLAAQRLATTTQPEGRIRAADEIILGANAPDQADHPDAKAVLTALKIGYGSATAARAFEVLRAVPRSSPFSHWVLFFKGMAALETGDRTRAADCFRRVPESSLLQASIPAFLTICTDAPSSAPPPRAVHALCAWAGHPKLAEALLRADPLWHKNQRAKALVALVHDIPDLFRFGARDFLADLARFLTSHFVRAQQEDYPYAEALLSPAVQKSRGAVVAVTDLSFFALPFESLRMCAHRHFETALKNLDSVWRVFPAPPAMRSRVFTNLAATYITAVKKDRSDECSGPNARTALDHAIKHDPDHLNAWLMKCDLLALGIDRSAYHRFLDDLTKRFPAHKEVLIRNGECCADRKSHTKALRNFQSAAQLDSVDPRIHAGLIRARLGIAEEAYKKGKAATVDWADIESLASSNKSCRHSALWRLRVRRIVLEAKHGASEHQLAALAAATLPHAPSAFLLESACRFAMAAAGQYILPHALEVMFAGKTAPASLDDFIAIIDEVDAFPPGSKGIDASITGQTILREHAAVLSTLTAARKDLLKLIFRILTSPNADVIFVSPQLETWFKRDPADPMIRLICATWHFIWLPPHYDPDDPNKLIRQLMDSRDPDANRLALLVQQRRKRLVSDRPADRIDLDFNPHDNPDFDDEDDDDDDFGDLTALDELMATTPPAKLAKLIGSLLEQNGIPGFPKPSRK